MQTVIRMSNLAQTNRLARLLFEMSIDRWKTMQKQDTYRGMTVSCTDLRLVGCPAVGSKSLVAARWDTTLFQAQTSGIRTKRKSFQQARAQSSISIRMQNGKGKSPIETNNLHVFPKASITFNHWKVAAVLSYAHLVWFTLAARMSFERILYSN